MTNKFLVFLLLLMSEKYLYGQDLIVSAGNITGSTFYTSDLLEVAFQIKNLGPVATPYNHAEIAVADNKNGIGLYSLGYISIPALSSNQTTPTIKYKLPFQ